MRRGQNYVSWESGAPLSFTAVNTLNEYGTATARLVNLLPANYEQVFKGNGYITYYPALTQQTAPSGRGSARAYRFHAVHRP